MTTPGEMVMLVADALLLPSATVNSYFRMLREDELVTRGGRGRSAAQMGPDDVAKLLITVMGSEKLDEATAKCRLLSSTLSFIGVAEDGKKKPIKKPITLVEGVTILLEQMRPRNDLQPEKLPTLPFLGDMSNLTVYLEICASTLESRIMTQFPSGGRSLDFYSPMPPTERRSPEEWDSLSIQERILQKADAGGLLTMRSIDRTALIRLSYALIQS